MLKPIAITAALVAAAAALLAAGFFAIAGLALSENNTPPAATTAPAQLPLQDPSIYRTLSLPDDVELTNQHGQTITTAELTGDHWLILDFMFSNCTLACPTMKGNMARVQDAITTDRLRFASISVDPVNDTPDQLADYARRFQADHRWSFLATDPGEAEAILEGLQQTITLDTSEANKITLPDGSEMFNIIHPVRFIVFNPEGQIVGSYRGTDPEDVDSMIQDLRTVLAAEDA